MGFLSKLVGAEAVEPVAAEAAPGTAGTEAPAPDPTPPAPAPSNYAEVKLLEVDIGYQDNGNAFAVMYFKYVDEVGNTQINATRVEVGESVEEFISALKSTAERLTK